MAGEVYICIMWKLLQKRWFYHSLIWLGAYLLFFLLAYETDWTLLENLVDPIFILIPLAFITYSGFWAKANLFDKRKYWLYVLSLLLITFVGMAMFQGLKLMGHMEGNGTLQNMSNIIFTILFSTGLQYFKRGIISQQQLQELRAKTAETELNALKAQINPHFLFNTLNNIYGINQIDSEKGSEMILELSDVMRYHLEFSKLNMVRLEEETELIQSYIRLEELRLTENCDLKVDVSSIDPSLKVSPLLFLPFVENAFKHGTHPLKPCFVHIQLKTIDDKIIFNVINSIVENKKIVKTNIGLENTQRRLELMYPNKHSLKVDKSQEKYSLSLIIKT